MPDFSRREKELNDSFDAAKDTFHAGERIQCADRLKALYPGRASALTAILAPLTDPGLDPKAREAQDKYQLLLDQWVLRFSHLTDGLIIEAAGTEVWREKEEARETAFLKSLVDLDIEQFRDDLAKLEVGLQNMIAALDKKWVTMGDEAKRLEDLEAEAYQKMNKIVQGTLSGGTDAWARYGDSLSNFLAYFMKIPVWVNEAVVYLAKEAGIPDQIAELFPKLSMAGVEYFNRGKELGIPAADLARGNPELMRDPGMAVSETIQKNIGSTFELFVTGINLVYKNLLPLATVEYNSQMRTLQGLMPNQGVILMSVSQTQRDVDDFLKNCGLDRARDLYERAESALDRWADSQPTDGLKADAREFAAPIKNAFKDRYDRMANAFGVFVQANQGRFIGAVKKDIENQLIFTDVWADRTQGLLDIGMDARIREWRDGTMKLSDQLATASSQVFEQMRTLPPELLDKITDKLNDYWAQMQSRIKTETDQATATLSAASDQINNDRIRKDLDRSALRRQLAA
jgi:hypothetical protein